MDLGRNRRGQSFVRILAQSMLPMCVSIALAWEDAIFFRRGLLDAINLIESIY